MIFFKKKKTVFVLFLFVGMIALPCFVLATANFNVQISPAGLCSDTIDNDGDGLIDYGADPGCSSFADNDETDSYGHAAQYSITGPNTSVVPDPDSFWKRGDLNGNQEVTLVDLSILLAWYKQPLNEDMKYYESTHFNNDGVIDLIDISIEIYLMNQ